MTAPAFTPLELETRPTVCTAAAAHYLHLRPQTLRVYACKECGPIRPIRINGRLHWSTQQIRALLGAAQPSREDKAANASGFKRASHTST